MNIHNGGFSIIQMNYQDEQDELADDDNRAFLPQTAVFQSENQSPLLAPDFGRPTPHPDLSYERTPSVHQVHFETRPDDKGGVQMQEQRPASNGIFAGLDGDRRNGSSRGSGQGSNIHSSSRYVNVDNNLVKQQLNEVPFTLGQPL